MISYYRCYSLLFLIIFTIFGVFKPINLLPDMGTYQDYFNNVKTGVNVLVEYSFILVSKLVLSFSDSFRWVIFLYVFISLYVKFNCFIMFKKKNAIFLMYISSLLILHEFIQIRIALAISLLFLSSILYVKGYSWRAFFLFLFSILIHTSSIVFVFIFYVSIILEARRRFVFILIPFVFVFSNFFLDILSFSNFILPDYIYDKLILYINVSQHMNQSMNIFSVRMMVLYILMVLILYKLIYLSKLDFVYFFCVSLLVILSIGFKSIPDIAFRLVDIAIFFSIFLIQSTYKYYQKSVFYFSVSLFIISSIYYNYRLLAYTNLY
ncbi:EpsG family protein [Shewanella inventionis]|uniref:EpsG family protein n=1 Tax=Shewanella inventionis TaxID=1738770 RepID=UPI001CC08B0D|nr:EpsG family protein [Shewanella inventionis]